MGFNENDMCSSCAAEAYGLKPSEIERLKSRIAELAAIIKKKDEALEVTRDYIMAREGFSFGKVEEALALTTKKED